MLTSFYSCLPQKRNAEGNTVLHVAALEDRPLVLKALLEKASNVNIENKDHESPMVIAVTQGHEEICKLLCDEKCINRRRKTDGACPLHIAVEKGKVKVAVLLINRGARLDKENKDGNIPLHLAAQLGSQDDEELIKKTDQKRKQRTAEETKQK